MALLAYGALAWVPPLRSFCWCWRFICGIGVCVLEFGVWILEFVVSCFVFGFLFFKFGVGDLFGFIAYGAVGLGATPSRNIAYGAVGLGATPFELSH